MPKKNKKALAAIILAAGKGTRMKSSLPKVLHRVAGRPMLYYPVKLLEGLGAAQIVVVVGFGKEAVARELAGHKVSLVHQKELLGTGHAVMTALKTAALKGFTGDVLILSGDVPLITKETIKALVNFHRRSANAPLSLVTAILKNPAGYGRVVRDAESAVMRIMEDRDCDPAHRSINEVNAGIYLADARFLSENIGKLKNKNAQGEYYLPDLVPLAVKKGLKVSILTHLDSESVMGINNRMELAKAGRIMRKRILDALMTDGVTIVDPENTYVDSGVKIGRDTVVYPGAHIKGDTVIGDNCIIEEGVKIIDSSIGAGSTIKSYSIIEDTRAGDEVSIGPFARLRQGNVISDNVRIGNFVEVKKSVIGRGTKANHLSYLGDSIIGKDVNIGAGTITCNYDGVKKHKTVIADGAFIGSDTQLIAPVKVGKGAYVGSRTTVTRDVPAGALIITRAKEKIVKDWTKKRLK